MAASCTQGERSGCRSWKRGWMRLYRRLKWKWLFLIRRFGPRREVIYQTYVEPYIFGQVGLSRVGDYEMSWQGWTSPDSFGSGAGAALGLSGLARPSATQITTQQGCSDRLSSSVANLFFDNIYDHQAKVKVMEALTYRTTVAGLQ